MGWFRIRPQLAPLLLTFLLVEQSHSEAQQMSPVIDADRDGLDDKLEQSLLEKFIPTFYLSEQECDGWPAEFLPERDHPQVLARNGTIYGQVFPITSSKMPGELIEIHYYHLWGRDCGKAGHGLDAEHVSVLVRAGTDDRSSAGWTAVLWYAAAHEDTVCDSSSGAKAQDLEAEHQGSAVWISRGKHASFLSPRACSWGCGGDVCSGSQPLRPPKIVNLGEPGAPLNGAIWVRSNRWPMLSKMGVDFTDGLIGVLGRSKLKGVATLSPQLRPTQAVLLAGDSTADALDVSGKKTGIALAQAGSRTDGALERTAEAVEEAGVATTGALAISAAKTGDALGATAASTANATARTARSTARALGTTLRQTGRFLGAGRK